jgi:exodeoxyribonuclease VII small subunit
MAAAETLTSRFERWEFVLSEGTFEEALEALDEIVGRLDEGHLSLDDSIRCYEFGVLIARQCEKMLDMAELRISRLDEDGARNEIDDTVDDVPL